MNRFKLPLHINLVVLASLIIVNASFCFDAEQRQDSYKEKLITIYNQKIDRIAEEFNINSELYETQKQNWQSQQKRNAEFLFSFDNESYLPVHKNEIYENDLTIKRDVDTEEQKKIARLNFLIATTMQSVGIYQNQISLRFGRVPTFATQFRYNSETGLISYPAILINPNRLDFCFNKIGEQFIRHMVQHECAHAALGHAIEDIICRDNLGIKDEDYQHSEWRNKIQEIRELVADNYFAINNKDIARNNVYCLLLLLRNNRSDNFSLERCAHAINLLELVWQENPIDLLCKEQNSDLFSDLISQVKGLSPEQCRFPLITFDNQI